MEEWKWSNGLKYEKSLRPTHTLIKNAEPDDKLICNITQSNRREDLDDKIANREMIFQRGINPFAINSDYVKDVVAQDTFLKPVNTSIGKLKTNDNNN